jgi:hypothetical protein
MIDVSVVYAAEIIEAQELGNKHLPNQYGRFSWVAGEWGRAVEPYKRCLNMSKASLGDFMFHALRLQLEVYQIYAFAPEYKQCSVLAGVMATVKQRQEFMDATKFYLSPSPTIHVN